MSPSLLSSQRITKLVWNRCGSAQDMSWGRCRILQPTRKLSGALQRQDRKRKESLQLYCWNLNIWIKKNLCEILIGGDDISNDIITLSKFVYIRASFRFMLIGANLTAQSTGSHRGTGGRIQIPEM